MVMSGENRDPQAEPGIGRRLERARESKGLSLWQVEQETRIRSRYLRDLEREDFDVLPAVYVLGSLKTYADFLGLDGAALSRQLKARLVEPDVPAQLAALGGAPGEDDEHKAAPAIGFDQLFLGMGVILISILAIMTLAAAVAQGDRSPVSQIKQPSTPETPSKIALAGNVQDGDKGAEDGGSSTAGNKEARPEDGPEASKSEESKDEGEKGDQNASQAASVFGDAKFVAVSPSSTTASASAASASASPAPSSPAPSSPAPSSPAPTTAKPDDSPVSPAPATAKPDDSPVSPAPATAGASSKPADDNPGAASAPSDAPAGPEGGVRSSPRATVPDAGTISAGVDRKIDEAFQENGLDR
jgi:cytoskeletal protein RodZ